MTVFATDSDVPSGSFAIYDDGWTALDIATAEGGDALAINVQLLKLGYVSGSSKLGFFFIPSRPPRAPTERLAA